MTDHDWRAEYAAAQAAAIERAKPILGPLPVGEGDPFKIVDYPSANALRRALDSWRAAEVLHPGVLMPLVLLRWASAAQSSPVLAAYLDEHGLRVAL